ncbi:SGNH/GDSL hydrolase family protein [Mesorhizobium sp. NPDC059054]|uniref:SGNH/GDSL hydrolase family protein n=1 Tax=Mesorhizobium sp. NPDC059054 TaxID=3346711 RepID=UPI0036C6D7BD
MLALAVSVLAAHAKEIARDGAATETAFHECLSMLCSIDLARRFALGKPTLGGSIIYEEPVFLGKSLDRELIFPPAKILAVRKPTSPNLLVEGRDYVATRKGIRFLPSLETKEAPAELANATATDNSNLYIGVEYQEYQYWVTYQRPAFAGILGNNGYKYAPTCGGLPLKDLLSRPKVRVTIFGDSISDGANASAQYVYPNQLGYVGLVEAYLSARFPSKWAFRNTSVAGWSTLNAISALDTHALDIEADLFVIAFGMNDAAATPQEYEERLRHIVGRIAAKYPSSYVLLVSSLSANPRWDKVDAALFKGFSHVVRTIASTDPKIACADMFDAWKWMMERKAYLDLTGNGVNHPNDFGHRVQADVVLNAILGDEYKPIEF